MFELTQVGPTKSRYGPGEDIVLRLTGRGTPDALSVSLYHLGQQVVQQIVAVTTLATGGNQASICRLTIPRKAIPATIRKIDGFATVFWVVVEVQGIPESKKATAIQIGDIRDAPIRYGFSTEFSDGGDAESAVEALTDYNLTHLQFYDWMYRHAELVGKTTVYTDALGRRIDGTVIREKIEASLQRGIQPIAYGAIYGADLEFYRDHGRWALFRRDGTPHQLGDFLMIMNIARGAPWREHLISEYRRAVEVYGFRGIHMDTYGFPKRGYDSAGVVVDIGVETPSLVEETRRALSSGRNGEKPTLIFNAVNNWPVRAAAAAPVDALYVEVWSPNIRYRDLVRIASEARTLKKTVPILAAYLSPFVPQQGETKRSEEKAVGALLYSTAVIYSAGATHLVLGEGHGVLCDPYYVNHGVVPEWARSTVADYYSFTAAYAELLAGPDSIDITLDHAHGPDDEVSFHGLPVTAFPEAGAIWACVRETDTHYVVSFVNFTNCKNDLWNTGHSLPEIPASGLKIVFTVAESLSRCFSAAPDEIEPVDLTLHPTQVPRGPAYSVDVPPIDLWRLVWVEKRSG